MLDAQVMALCSGLPFRSTMFVQFRSLLHVSSTSLVDDLCILFACIRWFDSTKSWLMLSVLCFLHKDSCNLHYVPLDPIMGRRNRAKSNLVFSSYIIPHYPFLVVPSFHNEFFRWNPIKSTQSLVISVIFENIILFSTRTLRLNNVCAWYFIGVSCANLLGLNSGGLTRILLLLDNFTLEITSSIVCKLWYYFIQSGAIIGRYFLCLISIDRWMITLLNDSIRGKSSPKIARNQIIFVIIGLAIFSVHVPVRFEIRNGRCFAYMNDSYAIFFNVYNMMIIFIPIIIMSLFSIVILVNIRQSHSRVEPSSTKANGQRDM